MSEQTDDIIGNGVIPKRDADRPDITDSEAYDVSSVLRQPRPLPQATAQDVRAAKKAARVEEATTEIMQQVRRQTNELRGITDDLTHVLRARADTAVFVEQKATDFLEEKRRQALIRQQMHIDDVLAPKQLDAQAQKLDLAAAQRARTDRDADTASRGAERTSDHTARTAAARAQVEAEDRAFRNQHERSLLLERNRRANEREEAEHKLALAQAAASLKNVTTPPKQDPFGGAASGDYAEAMSIAEDVADGLVVTDSRHTYHAFAALMWLESQKRGVPREEALRRVATKVLDRQLRHPLDERAARMYENQYLDARKKHEDEIAAANAAREEQQRAEAAAAAAKLQAETEVQKAQMERDAAFARERTAKVFVDADSFDPEDPENAN